MECTSRPVFVVVHVGVDVLPLGPVHVGGLAREPTMQEIATVINLARSEQRIRAVIYTIQDPDPIIEEKLNPNLQ